jgi:cbb3-type cytochrome oxidase subunit 1
MHYFAHLFDVVEEEVDSNRTQNEQSMNFTVIAVVFFVLAYLASVPISTNNNNNRNSKNKLPSFSRLKPAAIQLVLFSDTAQLHY